MTVRSVDRDVERMLDEWAITKLIYQFSDGLDTRDFDAYGETFTEDGVFEIFGQRRTGRDAIVSGARELAGFAHTQHFNTNLVVDVDGDEARARSSLFAVHVPDASAPERHADVGARYHYHCFRTEAGWRFQHVRVEITWTAGVPFQPPST